MVSDGIIPSIVSLVLAKDMDTVHYSCAALCHLCCTIENAKLILESGAVKNLVHGALEGKMKSYTRELQEVHLHSRLFLTKAIM
jgi:hypothetical protein